jgi:hypothetical protein
MKRTWGLSEGLPSPGEWPHQWRLPRASTRRRRRVARPSQRRDQGLSCLSQADGIVARCVYDGAARSIKPSSRPRWTFRSPAGGTRSPCKRGMPEPKPASASAWRNTPTRIRRRRLVTSAGTTPSNMGNGSVPPAASRTACRAKRNGSTRHGTARPRAIGGAIRWRRQCIGVDSGLLAQVLQPVSRRHGGMRRPALLPRALSAAVHGRTPPHTWGRPPVPAKRPARASRRTASGQRATSSSTDYHFSSTAARRTSRGGQRKSAAAAGDRISRDLSRYRHAFRPSAESTYSNSSGALFVEPSAPFLRASALCFGAFEPA